MRKDLPKMLDKLIMDRLITNSKVPMEELAAAYGVSPGTIRNRIAQLSESNVIIGYKARARLSRLGMSEVIVGLEIEPESYVKAMNSIKGLQFVKELYRSSGDHSAIAVIASDSESIDSEIGKMMSIEGVRKVYPSYIQEVVK
ncbi:Lrp/AsnC family transcriptional regulator [Candidatus Marsarchaeota archaeon]|nr:Lrp/AsnC family transcriptional regulator [Candidatus Marsarchaeota archaeon]